MSARDQILDAAERIARNDGRLSSDSSADLDLAQDDFEEGLAAYVHELIDRRTTEILASGWDASIASARINEAVHIAEMAHWGTRGERPSVTAPRRRPGALNRQLMRVLHLGEVAGEDYDATTDQGRFAESDIERADVVNSLLLNDAGEIVNAFKAGADERPLPVSYRMHAPVLDIDFAAELVPSSTPGHYHLYLDKSMIEDDYRRLLTVLGEVGILEPGYVAAALARGYSSVRLPWVKKGDGTLHSDRLPPAGGRGNDGRPF